ncbi:hypothetical protein GCM10011273_10580 [Asticcacaulis endophyticus]|uniref:Uncharacterized protein n=1 Tax=Asticcacaulis endophyticus TaxID=1395890 RepID=A0A918UQA9_9CAUL|nr:hypothetical protein GCM10011273_10580 [Asticcacaulis endophyticus]
MKVSIQWTAQGRVVIVPAFYHQGDDVYEALRHCDYFRADDGLIPGMGANYDGD